MRFSIVDLENLICRTRLKIAASMLHFQDYGDFAEYSGPRWNYYLREIIAAIPIPLVFGKGNFETGVAAKLLDAFVENPFPYLDPEAKKKMQAVNSALLRKFIELAFDCAVEMRWQETKQVEDADNIDMGPLTEADLQNGLLARSANPF